MDGLGAQPLAVCFFVWTDFARNLLKWSFCDDWTSVSMVCVNKVGLPPQPLVQLEVLTFGNERPLRWGTSGEKASCPDR